LEPVLLYFYIHCFSSLSSLSLFEQVKVDCGVSIHIIELESGKFRTRRFIESSLEHGEHEQQDRERTTRLGLTRSVETVEVCVESGRGA
jgi:hypothetical protein